MTLLILPLNDADPSRIAAALAQRLDAEAGTLETRRFPDGETYLRVHGAVQGRDVVIAGSLDRPDDKLVRLYLLASTLRDLGARRVILAAPYLAHMRQDRVFNDGEGISARDVAHGLSGCLDGLVTVDPHLHRIHTLDEVERWRERSPVLVDDIVSTARTMIAAVRHLHAAGLPAPVCIAVHAIFAGSAYHDLLRSGARRVASCNSIPHPSKLIDLHPRIADAVRELLALDAPSNRSPS